MKFDLIDTVLYQSPDRIVAQWREDRVYDVLRDSYDHIVVYGSSDVYDTVREYRFDEDLAAKTRYVNYVGAPRREQRLPRDPSLRLPNLSHPKLSARMLNWSGSKAECSIR